MKGAIIDSSAARLSVLHSYPAPSSRRDVINMLSDVTGKEYRVFQSKRDAVVKTIAVGQYYFSQPTGNVSNVHNMLHNTVYPRRGEQINLSNIVTSVYLYWY